MMTDRIEKTIDVKAPVDRVWRALSDSREFGKWFGVELDGPFAPGEVSRGRLTISGCENLNWEVEIVSMEEPRYLAFKWHPNAVDPDIDYTEEEPTLVEFTLEPTAAGSRLTVVESGFDALPAGRRADAMRQNDKGWTFQMDRIKAYAER